MADSAPADVLDPAFDPAFDPVLEPVLRRGAQVVGGLVGVVTLAAGGVAVFATSNEVGSAALVTAGVAIAGVSVFANRIRGFEAAGVRLEFVRQARDVSRQAERARAAGDVGRAEELEHRADRLLAAATTVGSRYEELRRSEPPGWERTSRMEGALRDARAVDPDGLTASHVADIFGTGREGNRVFALALIERHPRLASAEVLVDAIGHSRSAFEQYHALLATEGALDSLSGDERARVHDAVASALAGALGERSSDRRTVARRVLARLTPADGT